MICNFIDSATDYSRNRVGPANFFVAFAPLAFQTRHVFRIWYIASVDCLLSCYGRKHVAQLRNYSYSFLGHKLVLRRPNLSGEYISWKSATHRAKDIAGTRARKYEAREKGKRKQRAGNGKQSTRSKHFVWMQALAKVERQTASYDRRLRRRRGDFWFALVPLCAAAVESCSFFAIKPRWT